MRLGFYVGERDLLGIGFSDNVIFRKQYYARAVLSPELTLELHTGEEFAQGGVGKPMRPVNNEWAFDVGGTGFEATLRASFELVPEVG